LQTDDRAAIEISGETKMFLDPEFMSGKGKGVRLLILRDSSPLAQFLRHTTSGVTSGVE